MRMPAPSPVDSSAPDCAAVHEIQQHLPAVLDDGVAAASGNIDDGADAASIVFPLRVVQTSSAWHGKSVSGGILTLKLRTGSANRAGGAQAGADQMIIP